MFETNRQVKEAFEKFRSMDTPSELWQSSVLETHGMVVMNAIDEIICNFDDRETVVELIIEQGRSHVRFGDLTEDLFWSIEEAFLHAVKETLDKNYPQHLQVIYKKAIRFIINLLVIGFKSAMREANKGYCVPEGPLFGNHGAP
ncbi:hypothetical protein CAPTEDRAFT_194549 [Capitella teleta]|uniref:Globin domain-containing protein n=1 Tax=Capitella teleta TaxID=283909 RepID=R7UCZ3_CAPTE|nr:hypothetical protein CAPTEDRAFT_194549 [Capitella teleta]|eukprot:ELU04260.1 hypothetical protein CAPTEDRAFT_194549 [Capitella teleta]